MVTFDQIGDSSLFYHKHSGIIIHIMCTVLHHFTESHFIGGMLDNIQYRVGTQQYVTCSIIPLIMALIIPLIIALIIPLIMDVGHAL